MSERGVFAVDRGVWDHPLFDSKEPLTKREAWLWLISEASWKPRTRYIGSATLEISRGALAHSIRFIAEAWGWPKSNVARFLDRLKTETMIEAETVHGLTVINICKYDEYQRVSLPDRDKIGTDAGTRLGQRRDKLEDNKTIKTDSEAIASGASAPIDHRKRLFNEGLQKLARLTGKGPDACRSFVGKCLKAASDDAIVVLGLIEDAERNQVVDPGAWISARLKPLEERHAKTKPGGSILAAIDRELAKIGREENSDFAAPAHSVLLLPARSVR